jgi:hypothetical protein
MSDNKDLGSSFRRLFFRDSEPEQNNTPEQNKAPQSGFTNGGGNFIQNTGLSASNQSVDKTLVEDFVQRLHNLINQSNQPGFDFLEFTETLFEETQTPNAEVFKTVFRIAQKIDKSLTPEHLLDSSKFYRNLVQQTADAEISKGESKKQSLFSDKDTEKRNLENSLKDTKAKIDQLNKQIQDLQKQEITISNQLSEIDQKYNSQFVDIDNKIGAIKAAKEQVIVSIVDIEAGITTNLK